MPYTKENVPKHVPQEMAAHWAEVFNGVLAETGSEEKALAAANAILQEMHAKETRYLPLFAAATFVAAEAAGVEADGWTWPVKIMQAGFAGGTLEGDGQRMSLPHFFTKEVVAQVAQAANGARFGRRHPRDEEDVNNPDRIAGWYEDGKLVSEAAHATLHLLKSEAALREKLTAARQAGKLELFNLSFFGLVGFRAGKIEGREALISTRLGKLISVDLVTEAGAGGEFLKVAAGRALASEIHRLEAEDSSPLDRDENHDGAPGNRGGRTFGGAMKEKILKLLEALRKLDSGRADKLTTELGATAEAAYPEFLLKITEAAAAAAEIRNPNPPAGGETGKKADPVSPSPGPDVLALAKETLDEARKIQCANLIERKLSDSKLPPPALTLAREHLGDRIVDAAAIDGEIKRVREAFAAFSNVGKVSTEGGVLVGRETRDKVQLALDAMLGVKEAVTDKNVRPFRGIKEAYVFCTGDRDLTFGAGGFHRVSEAIASGDFPNLLLNSMTKRLLQDYAELGMGGLERLITTVPLGDFKTQDRVRMGYLGDLPTVVEAADYLELTKPTDEKISYAVGKRGGLLTISEETIRNDDLGKIAAFPGRLARAGRRTVKQFITDFFVNNPNYDPDSTSWFHANHTNLGSLALSATELDARKILLMKQTEKDSGKRLGLPLNWIMVPVDLEPTARQLNRNDEGTNNWFGKFGANDENIIVNELLTDANDWYYGAWPADAPFIEIGFLDGIQSPQIFLQNDPRMGVTFANDQIQYKAKYAFGGDIINFRSVGKNVV